MGLFACVSLSVIPAVPAAAVSPGVGFTGDALSTWQTDGIVWTLAEAGSRVYAGGSFASVRPPGAALGTSSQPAANMVVLDSATGAPTACRLDFTIGTGTATVRSTAVSADGGTLYVGGYFGAVNGISVSNLAAIDTATCTPSATFHPAVASVVRAMAVSGDTLYLAGDFVSVGGQPRQYLAAVDGRTGAVRPWLADADQPARAIAVTPDGTRVIVGGEFSQVRGANSRALAVLSASDGSLVRAYPAPFIPSTSAVKDIAVDAASNSFYIGAEGTGGGVFDGRAAFSLDTLDQRWRDTCLGATQAVLVFQGALYAGHHLHDCRTMGGFPDRERQYLTAQSTADGSFLGWYPDTNAGNGEGIGPRDLMTATGSGTPQLWLAGEFTTVNGKAQQSLTRFGSTPDIGSPSLPVVNVSSLAKGTAQVHIQGSQDTDDADLTYSVFRNGGSTPVWTGSARSWWYTQPQLTFVDTGLTPGTTVSYRVRASDGVTSSVLSTAVSTVVADSDNPYASAVLADSPEMFLRYDDVLGTTFAADSSSGRVDGTYSGGTTRAAGALSAGANTALGLNGTSAYAYTDAVRAAPADVTVETWLRTTTTRGGRIVGFSQGNMRQSTTTDRQLYMLNDGRVSFGVQAPAYTVLTSPNPLNDGAWHHLVGTRGPEGMALYVDGVRVGLNGVSGSVSYTGYWRVGWDTTSGWPSRPTSAYFAGELDETAAYTKVLTADRVAAHYRASGRTLAAVPTPADAYGRTVSGDGPLLQWRLDTTSGSTLLDSTEARLDATRDPSTSLGVAGALATGTALRLEGGSVGAAAAVRSTGSPNDYTLETWVRSTSTRGGRFLGMGSSPTGTSTTVDRQLYLRDDGRVSFGYLNGNSRTAVSSTSAINDGVWHHVVATRTAGATRLYVDGALAASGGTNTTSSTTGWWRLGGDRLTSWPNTPRNTHLAGDLDEVAVYGKALSASAVFAHYATARPAADATPPSAVSGLAATVGANGVTLAWDSATDNVGVVRYEVYRSNDPSVPLTAGNLIGQPTTTSWTDEVAPGAWNYRVRAVDSAGNAGPASAVQSVDTSGPTQVTGLELTRTPGGVSLSWAAATDNVGVVTYRVYRTSSPTSPLTAADLVAEGASTSATDTPPPATWSYRVVAVDGAGNVGPASDPVTRDLAPPSAPTAFVGSANGTAITLTWAAATDNEGVVGYEVLRSATPDAGVDGSTVIATVSTTTSSDTPAAGSWVYRVRATDAAGNVGPVSLPVTVDNSAPEPPTVATVPVSLDTYVNQGAPSATYGTSTSLASRGATGTTAYNAYLNLTLPGAPVGKHLTKATLRVLTTSQTIAGSVDTHQVRATTSAWSDATTWNTRPTLGTAVLGELRAGTVPSTAYEVSLDVTAIEPLLGGDIGIALTSQGSDNLWIGSKEATASQRPTLVLEFSNF
ncbi:LamG-like jellyroll fold domain-containing protein [Knoellia sp. LjRoot47]|uniref:LamG-like jellyroll fold domain-containing protein n=1 Tax=Knoellia sp. LjRoot47 TaxID=3342330 RepID=UPI003ED145B8